jgi:hypothetical protein
MAPLIFPRTVVVGGSSSSSSSSSNSNSSGLTRDQILEIVFGVVGSLLALLAVIPLYFLVKKRKWPFRWWPADAPPHPVDPSQQSHHQDHHAPSSASAPRRARRTSRSDYPMSSAPSSNGRSGGAGGWAPTYAYYPPARPELE